MSELLVADVVTERLRLRALRVGDLDAVHEMQSDPDVVRYLYWEVRSREQSAEWLQGRVAADRLAADGDAVAYAVERRADGRVVGSVNAWLRSVEHRQGEIGFVLLPAEQGCGYAYEAAHALVDLLFRRLDLHRVTGSLDARNTRSAALLRRLGMRQEAHLRENEFVKGEWTDELVFAVLRREWDTRRTEARGQVAR